MPSKNFLSDLVRMSALLLGPFLLGALVVVLGLALYLWLEEPKRLAMLRVGKSSAVLLEQRPAVISPTQTDLVVLDPPNTAFFTGASTNAAIWANGKSFDSGGSAQWEFSRKSWPLWVTSVGLFAVLLLVSRPPRQGT